jgi:hypothetical protein
MCGYLSLEHKVLTYVEYRAVFGVFQNMDPPLLQSAPSKCVLPPHQRRGDTHTLAGRWGEGGGVNNFGRRQTLDWLLTV